MGWSHSVFVAAALQRAHEHLVDTRTELQRSDRIMADNDFRIVCVTTVISTTSHSSVTTVARLIDYNGIICRQLNRQVCWLNCQNLFGHERPEWSVLVWKSMVLITALESVLPNCIDY